MDRHSTRKSRAAYSVRVVCGLLFVLFCGLYLLAQSPLLEAFQYALSQGKTSYSPWWGACIITLTLCLLQGLSATLSCWRENLYALSYFPSVLLLVYLTDKGAGLYEADYAGRWDGVLCAGLLIYVLAVWVYRSKYSSMSGSAFSAPSCMASNVLILSLLAACTLFLGNTDAAFHYKVQTENLIRRGDFSRAAEVGKGSRLTDSGLFALRAYTLSRMDSLGAGLFAYPAEHGAEELLLPSHKPVTFLKAEDLYAYLGGRPRFGEDALHYLSRICRTETGNHPALDYYLCALLLEKELDMFVKELQESYEIDDSLPRHYKEALVLYRHRHGEYEMPFDTSEMEQDYSHFLADPESAKQTYWWYYFHYR